MEADEAYAVLNRKIKNVQVSGGGVTNYADLDGKPRINGVTLQGNLAAEELGIEEFSGNYQDLQGVPKSLPNPHPVTFGGMLPFKSYDGSELVNVTFPDVEILNETAGTPVGEIISYMGTVAPANYLICDGAEYPIAEYPHLAQHFANDFGSANFFGGDGETTFAVPDLRGEFLRGTGEATRASGSGATVGTHQDGTVHTKTQVFGKRLYMFGTNNGTNSNTDGYLFSGSNSDKIILSRKYDFSVPATTINNVESKESIMFTSRPTNTSVLYCIKYKPTYFSQVQHTYSFEERRIGTWIDGKPLYEKVVDFGAMPNSAISVSKDHGIEHVKRIWISGGHTYSMSNATCSPISNANPHSEGCWTFWVNTNQISCQVGMDRSNLNALVILHYTKTTD